MLVNCACTASRSCYLKDEKDKLHNGMVDARIRATRHKLRTGSMYVTIVTGIVSCF